MGLSPQEPHAPVKSQPHTKGFSQIEQHISFSRQNHILSIISLKKGTSFYTGEWGMGKVSLENQGTRRGRGATISPCVGKPCHDLP